GVTRNQPVPLADVSLGMLFNGKSGFISVPNAAAVQLAGDLTIELWVNTPLASRQTLISKGWTGEFELTLEYTGALNLYNGNGTIGQSVISPRGAVAPNVWQHIVVTREAATRTVQFYVNGVAKGSSTYTLTVAPTASPISIGRNNGGPLFVTGSIDEVALYKVALSPA